MEVLIIGSEGFIGKELTAFLKQQGHTVTGADIIAQTGDDYHQINAMDPDYAKVMTEKRFDFCINASGQANVRQSFDEPKLDFDSNAVTVFRLLDAIRIARPTCKFLQLSSAAVYGNTTEPILRTDFPPQPFSPYGYHKWMAELVCSEFNRFYKLPTCCIRIFSVYGEGQTKLLFWDIWQKYNRQPDKIELFGSGDEKRDFIYIKDLARAVEFIMLHHPFDGTTVNVANGRGWSIREAATSFCKLLDAKTVLVFSQKSKSGDPNSLVADISTLATYGYQPAYAFEKGLSKYIQWLKEKK